MLLAGTGKIDILREEGRCLNDGHLRNFHPEVEDEVLRRLNEENMYVL